jgi:hypothetical protein
VQPQTRTAAVPGWLEVLTVQAGSEWQPGPAEDQVDHRVGAALADRPLVGGPDGGGVGVDELQRRLGVRGGRAEQADVDQPVVALAEQHLGLVLGLPAAVDRIGRVGLDQPRLDRVGQPGRRADHALLGVGGQQRRDPLPQLEPGVLIGQLEQLHRRRPGLLDAHRAGQQQLQRPRQIRHDRRLGQHPIGLPLRPAQPQRDVGISSLPQPGPPVHLEPSAARSCRT